MSDILRIGYLVANVPKKKTVIQTNPYTSAKPIVAGNVSRFHLYPFRLTADLVNAMRFPSFLKLVIKGLHCTSFDLEIGNLRARFGGDGCRRVLDES
jgi:hypothetical protein